MSVGSCYLGIPGSWRVLVIDVQFVPAVVTRVQALANNYTVGVLVIIWQSLSRAPVQEHNVFQAVRECHTAYTFVRCGHDLDSGVFGVCNGVTVARLRAGGEGPLRIQWWSGVHDPNCSGNYSEIGSICAYRGCGSRGITGAERGTGYV
jgi:hypothetical protein